MRLTSQIRREIMGKVISTLFTQEAEESEALEQSVYDAVAAFDLETHQMISNSIGIKSEDFLSIESITEKSPYKISDFIYLHAPDIPNASGDYLPCRGYFYVSRQQMVRWYGDNTGRILDIGQFRDTFDRMEQIYKEVDKSVDDVRKVVDGCGTMKSLLSKAPSLERLLPDRIKRQYENFKADEIHKAEERKRIAAEKRKKKLIAEQLADINKEATEAETETQVDMLTRRVAVAALKGDI